MTTTFFASAHCGRWSASLLANMRLHLTKARREDGDSFLLLYCDANWEPITDTSHQSLEDALDQAECEYVGTRETWVRLGAV